MSIGARILEMRKRRGLTQSRLADGIVTRNMLSQMENDAAQPSVHTLQKLAERLGVSAGWLLSGESDALQGARAAFAAGKWRDAIEGAQQFSDSDEALLLTASACCQAADEALDAGDPETAEEYANKGLACAKGLYAELQRLRLMGILALCEIVRGRNGDKEMDAVRSVYEENGTETAYRLLSARYHLAQGHLQAAERDLWLIIAVSPKMQGEYLLLRGRLAFQQGKFNSAAAFLRQAEDAGVRRLHLRELYTELSATLRMLDLRGEAKKYADLAKKIR